MQGVVFAVLHIAALVNTSWDELGPDTGNDRYASDLYACDISNAAVMTAQNRYSRLMRRSLPILESVRALYPKSANRSIMVRAAWRSEESMLERPEVYGSDGWTPVVSQLQLK